MYTEKSDFRGKTSAPCEFVLMEVDFSAVWRERKLERKMAMNAMSDD